MPRLHWLETAEYLSLGAAAVGTIAAAVTQQVVLYATTPFALSIGVSVANRQRLDRLRQQQTQNSLAQLQSSLLTPTSQKLAQLESDLGSWKTELKGTLESTALIVWKFAMRG
jgi:hypothetical protein